VGDDDDGQRCPTRIKVTLVFHQPLRELHCLPTMTSAHKFRKLGPVKCLKSRQVYRIITPLATASTTTKKTKETCVEWDCQLVVNTTRTLQFNDVSDTTLPQLPGQPDISTSHAFTSLPAPEASMTADMVVKVRRNNNGSVASMVRNEAYTSVALPRATGGNNILKALPATLTCRATADSVEFQNLTIRMHNTTT